MDVSWVAFCLLNLLAISNAIKYPRYLLTADIKICHAINPAEDSTLLSYNFIMVNISITKVTTFTRKTNALYYPYKLPNYFLICTNTTKDMGVLTNLKLYFSNIYICFANPLKILGLIHTTTLSFSALNSLLILYETLTRPKLEYASTACNHTYTETKKLEFIQCKFVALCQNRFCFPMTISVTRIFLNI
jgi:hypothetical protein